MYGGASALWILVRAILLSSTGYLHPDQIFQAQEPMFAFLYPNHTPAPKVPWEYSVDAPIRCSLFPSICAMVPYWIVGADSSSIAAFIAPRVVMVLAMIYAEASLRRICFNMGISSKGVLWIFQSSWAGLVIGARPFSNTAEMWMLVVLLRVLSRSQFQVSNLTRRNLLFGIVVGIGIFVRFTFLFYAFPLGIFLVIDYVSVLQAISTDRRLHCKQLFIDFFKCTFQVISGILLSSSIAILADYQFYGRFVITPLNNLIYNMDAGNLALHGVHPHYQHALINFPIMFGPLAIAFIRKILQRSIEYESVTSDVKEKKNSPKTAMSTSGFLWACFASVVSGIGLLSFAPHQEARFLLPALPLLSLICNFEFSNSNSRFRLERFVRTLIRGAWIVFNASMVIFMGYFHQGGVIKAALDAHNVITPNSHLLFYNLYFVPRSFMGSIPRNYSVTVEDLPANHADPTGNLMRRIEKIWSEKQSSEFSIYLYISAPAARSLNLPPPAHLPQMFKWTRVKDYFPHTSLEDPPSLNLNNPLSAQLSLELYQISSILKLI